MFESSKRLNCFSFFSRETNDDIHFNKPKLHFFYCTDDVYNMPLLYGRVSKGLETIKFKNLIG